MILVCNHSIIYFREHLSPYQPHLPSYGKRLTRHKIMDGSTSKRKAKASPKASV